MAHFAGIYALKRDQVPPVAWVGTLRREMRALGGNASICEEGPFVLSHIGRVPGGQAGGSASPGSPCVAAVAGGLVLPGQNGPDALAVAAAHDPRTLLDRANGTFAFVRFEPQSGYLCLATDPLGARPLYWQRSGDCLLFSTSIRVLARITGTAGEVDWQAVAEQGAFCYPLSDRTPVKGIQVLRDGEWLEVRSQEIHLSRYADWASTPLVADTVEGHASRLHAAFLEAVRDRRPAGGAAITLLSGGLDSRCLAAALLDLGSDVEAWNLGLEGWQDVVLAREFAAQAGIRLHSMKWDRSVLKESPGQTTASVLLKATSRITAPTAFSGDGGGETIGFLMMSPKVMNLFAVGLPADAIAAYLKGDPIAAGVVAAGLWRNLRIAPREAMTRELESLGDLPPQKAMQLFLLRNDMRRHLHDYFEFSEQHHTELQFPFYDRRVLAAVIAIAPPLEPFLGHRLYYEWMKVFQTPVSNVPWQHYPGHVPCPLPMSAGARPQWEVLRPELDRRLKDWRSESLRDAWILGKPHPALARTMLTVAAAASLLGRRVSAQRFRDYLWIANLCRLAAGIPFVQR